MTRQRDIGRVLDAWLAPGPIEAPDRILSTLADRIEHVPQRRYPRAQQRFHAMTPPIFKLAAAAAILFAAGLAISPLVNTTPNVASSPSPSASAEPVSTAVPQALRYRWFYGPGGDPGATAPTPIDVVIDDDSLLVSSPDFKQAHVASASSPDRLDLTWQMSGHCLTAKDASYAWTLSPSGTKLTLTPVSDDCADRVALLSHEFQRSDCRDSSAPCLGALEAGSYYSKAFRPGSVESPAGAMTYTVPDGWSNPMDYGGWYELVLTDDITSGLYDRSYSYSGIEVFARPAASGTGPDCWTEETGIGTGIDALLDWVRNRPGIVAGTPEPITIGGLSGYALDLELAEDWTYACPDKGLPDPMAPVLTEAGPRQDYAWGLQLGGDLKPNPYRALLLDLGAGHVVHIWIVADKAANFDAFLEQAMPVVESMRFTP